MNDETPRKSLNFIEQMVENDLKEGRNKGRIQTRFPPEPNGYLHIGHAKAICLDFGIAQKYGGICNLRFDDTNPVKEDTEYVDAIEEDIKWLGFDWANVYYASDYFGQLWKLAIQFIKQGKAYVDEQSAEEIAKQKGTPTVAGTESPYRNRSVEENLQLFCQMSNGEIEEGAMVLRAKIDMASPNMHFRDPIMYRIITSHPHHRTGNYWKVYPMYDYAHGQSDYFEGVTHSLCTLEFEVHRPLYDWYLDQIMEMKDKEWKMKKENPDACPSGNSLLSTLHPSFPWTYRPYQTEFNRLNITYTVMSKRKMLQLVQEGLVSGWDDPRMPTLSGMRRRGYTPSAIRDFIDRIGYTKYDGTIDMALLEHSVREDLKPKATRVCAILDPIKLVVTNYPAKQTEMLTTENNPDDENAGTREIPFGRELYIERDDFMEDAPKDFYRLSEGREVRLKSAYIVKCTGCKKSKTGKIEEVYCEYDADTKSGTPGSNRKVKSTINWVEKNAAVSAEIRLYDRLFTVEDPAGADADFRDLINSKSLRVLKKCRVEPVLAAAKPLDHFQFLKIGYFTVDADSRPGAPVFNQTVSLKDNPAKGKKV